MTYKTFIDVSKWQGTINWSTMKNSGVDAVYMRAYQGLTKDVRLDEYSSGAKSVELPFGLYIYWRPGHDFNQQITQFIDTHRDLGASLIPMLDIEHQDDKSPEEIGRQVNTAVVKIEELLGVTPVIYTAAWFWNPKVSEANVGRCPLWLARYSTPNPPPFFPADWGNYAIRYKQPQIPKGWSTWDAWQFSADGNHAGKTYGASSSHLDLNIMREESWIKFLVNKPMPEPPQVNYSKEYEMRLVDPVRLYDSRNVSRHSGGESRRIKVNSVDAVFVNVTAVDCENDGYLSVWSGAGAPPNISNLNYGKGQTVANSAWVPVVDGHIGVFTSSSCHVIVDLQAVV